VDLRDPTEAALLVSAAKAKISDERRRKREIPFDSQRKLMSVLVSDRDGDVIYTKGALGELLACCTRVVIGGAEHAMTSELLSKIAQQNAHYGGQARPPRPTCGRDPLRESPPREQASFGQSPPWIGPCQGYLLPPQGEEDRLHAAEPRDRGEEKWLRNKSFFLALDQEYTLRYFQITNFRQ
jgi:hypothetical protein